MKEGIKKFIFLKELITWGVIGFCCIVAIKTFIEKTFEDMAAGKEIFWPGILILAVAVLSLLVFSITRVIKYIKRLR